MRALMRACIAPAAILVIAGCGSQNSVTPSGDTPWSIPQRTVNDVDGVSNFLWGEYEFRFDVATMTGEVTPVRGASTIGDLYLLPIQQFKPVFKFKKCDMSNYGNDEIGMVFELRHPFPGPATPGGTPNGFSNRADLGVSGYITFDTNIQTLDPPSLPAPEDTNFDFGGGLDVDIDTRLVNPDPLANPVPELLSPIFRHSLWWDGTEPESQLYLARPFVDDSRANPDPELDVRFNLNDGSSIPWTTSVGNHASTTNWSTAINTPNQVPYTGFGVLHCGQGSYVTVPLSTDYLGALGSGPLYISLIATYTDPRGGANTDQKRLNRLPSGDPADFAYKMPHGAIDVEWVGRSAYSAATLGSAETSTVTFDLLVVDHDSTATVAALPAPPAPQPPLNTIPVASGVTSIQLASTELAIQETVTLPTPTGTGTYEDPRTFAGITITNNAAGGTTGGSDNGAWVAVRVLDAQATSGTALNGGGSILNDAAIPQAIDITADRNMLFSTYMVMFVPIL